MKQAYLLSVFFYLFISISSITNTHIVNQLESYYSGTPVLITGGCGFIGSHLATKLVNLGAEITIIDDLSTGCIDNIAHIQDQITFVHASITNIETCLQVTKNKKVVFHLAAFISVPASIKEPHLCHKINVDGTVNLLEAARQNNVEQFVFSSSAAVYGQCEGICKETDTPAPTSPYGFSKLVGELYSRQYALVFGLNTVMLRYFNVYGPRQNPNGTYAAVVAKFTHNMQHNLPITIFGDGKQTRDFIPVEQVVGANLFLGMCNPEYTRGQIFNVATNNSISLLELIDQLKQNFPHYTGNIQFGPERPGDIKHSTADCSKYFDLLANFSIINKPSQSDDNLITKLNEKDIDFLYPFQSKKLLRKYQEHSHEISVLPMALTLFTNKWAW